MIVVEGPDGSGKTTLIRHLARETGLPVAPRVVSKNAEAMVDLKQWVEDNVNAGFQATIFDRHRLFSEPIYGPILRQHFEPGFDDPDWFRTQLYSFYQARPVVIYCLPPFEVVWSNVEHDPENTVVNERRNMRAIWGAYLNKATTCDVLYGHTWRYDYTDEATALAIRRLLPHIINHRVQEMASHA